MSTRHSPIELRNYIWYQRRESNSLKAANLAERAYKTPRTPSLAGIKLLVQPIGIEPISTELHPAAITISAKVAYLWSPMRDLNSHYSSSQTRCHNQVRRIGDNVGV
jgi:hypothetical protein